MSLSSGGTATLRVNAVLPSLFNKWAASSIIVFIHRWPFLHHSLCKRTWINDRLSSLASLWSIIRILKFSYCCSGRVSGPRRARSILGLTIQPPSECLIFNQSFDKLLAWRLSFFSISRRIAIRTCNRLAYHTIPSHCTYDLLKDRFVCIFLSIWV